MYGPRLRNGLSAVCLLHETRFFPEPQDMTIRSLAALVLFTTGAGGVLVACDPYDRRQGEYHAGPVDPVNFPPEYLGDGGDRNRTGAGSFTAIPAYAGALPV